MSTIGEIASFKSAIAQTVSELGLDERKWGDEKWKSTWPLINQNVLDDAFNQQQVVRQIFPELSINFRTCKTNTRILQKEIPENPARPPYGHGFKVVSDFVAGRVNCPVTEILSKVDYVQKKVLELGGALCIKGTETRPFEYFMKEGKYTDITQYVHAFLPQIGYPLELQIGHELAAHTFTVDSHLRDRRNHKLSDDMVDLWNGDFYEKFARQYVLDKANGVIPTVTKKQVQDKAEEIHGGHEKVPTDLQKILDTL